MQEKYLIFCDGTAACITTPRDFTHEDWAEMCDAFEKHVGKRTAPYRSETHRLYNDQCRGNVYWTEWIASSQGAGFMLLPMENASASAVAECKRYIRRQRDVVITHVLPITKWVHDFDASKFFTK